MKISEYKNTNELLKRLNACKYTVEKTTKRQMIYNAAINDAYRIVDALPAADIVEVQHGRWEKTGVKRYYNDMMYVDFELKCSCCGKIKWMSEQQQPIDNYCPNCGARMDL